jgi:hypothetical protein
MSTFLKLPLDINKLIITFIDNPDKYTSQKIKDCAINLSNSCINKEFDHIIKPALQKLRQIAHLVNKYCKYNSIYANPGKKWDTKELIDYGGNPQLWDALCTGSSLPFAESTFKNWSPEIETDIKNIITLTPESLNCTIGELRCRNNVPPLVIASINPHVPLEIVEYMLQKGANQFQEYKLNGYKTTLVQDLEILDLDNKLEIEELLQKYKN